MPYFMALALRLQYSRTTTEGSGKVDLEGDRKPDRICNRT